MKIKKRNWVYTIFFAGILITTTVGCKKYEDGPAISLQSKKERVANTWIVDNFKINDNDYTSLVADYTETYTKEGSYFYSWVSFSGTGTWEFKSKNEEIWISGATTPSPKILYILKLEEEQFWYYYMDGNDKNEFHMVKK